MNSKRLIVFVIAAIWMQSPTAMATDLGAALGFGVLSTGGAVTFGTDSAIADGDVGGASILFRKDSSSNADLVANPKGIKMKSGSDAINCITNGAGVSEADGLGFNCSGLSTDGTDPKITTLAQAISDVATFVTAAQAATVTQPLLNKIVVDSSNPQSIIDTVTGGLNVITVPSIRVKKDAALTLVGSSTDSVVIIVAGNLNVGKDALVAPASSAGNFTESNVVILVLGKNVSVGKNAVMDATVVAPNAHCTLHAGFATLGAYICGKNVTISNEDGQGDAGAISTVPAGGVVL